MLRLFDTDDNPLEFIEPNTEVLINIKNVGINSVYLVSVTSTFKYLEVEGGSEHKIGSKLQAGGTFTITVKLTGTYNVKTTKYLGLELEYIDEY